ncbi:MAG: sigma-E processing peptidase SpoIIGA [Firmicutes bacterium]|nr:sigma-E processing peptidase SpoIIGA [Bacillota bacterium]
MDVYIELAFIDNFLLNGVLLFATLKILREQISFARVVVASAVGAIVAIMFPLLSQSGFLTSNTVAFILKLFLGFLLILIAHNFKTPKKYLLGYCLFVSATFLLGGMLIGFFFMLGVDYTTTDFLQNTSPFPVITVALAAAYYIFLMVKLLKHLTKQKSINPFIRQVDVYLDDPHAKGQNTLGKNTTSEYYTKPLKLKALIDSGNRLYDTHSNFPVVVMPLNTAKKLFPINPLTYLNNNTDAKEKYKVRSLNIKSVNATSTMTLFKPKKIVIYNNGIKNTIYNVFVGLSTSDFSDVVNYQMLLHPELV